MARRIKCKSPERRFTVLRVDGDARDTHAARSFEQALRLAQPDRGSRIEVFRTCAKDAGVARMPGYADEQGVRVRSFRYKGR